MNDNDLVNFWENGDVMEEFIGRYYRIQNIWQNEQLKKRMYHYYRLLKHNGQENAYYLICKSIPAEFDASDSLNDLWEVHNKQKSYFETNSESLVTSALDPSMFPKVSFLDLKSEIVDRLLKECTFCERLCRVDRSKGELGACKVGKDSYYSSAFLHHGEESPLVPSATIFFTGCNFACVFCQNEDLSQAGKHFPLAHSGIKTTPQRLAEVAATLVEKGAYNINWVGGDPIPNLHTIIDSLRFQKDNICQLWNSNFYNSLDSLKLLSDIMDVWLPDFKYGNNECGKKYSKVDRYWDILRRNFEYINSHGSKNIIVRHLVMPNHVECCSKPILKWLAETMGNHVVVNIMEQYRPQNEVDGKHYPEINRRVSKSEISEVFEYAHSLGLEYRSVS